jgi:salicylate 5-hydroxylase small subunit
VTPSVTFEDWSAITQFYARYASVVDAGDWDRWPEMFTDDCVYRLQPRENYERGLPLATLAFTSRGMLLDRVYSIKETLFHDPYYQRHIISSPIVHLATQCFAPNCPRPPPSSTSADLSTPSFTPKAVCASPVANASTTAK